MRTLILIFILVLTTFAYSQKKPKEEPVPEHLKSLFEMRKKMMEEMKKNFTGEFFDDPFFDQFFSDEDFVKGFHEKFKIQNDLYQSRWEENKDERILVLTPTNKEVPLDINLKQGMIQISAKSDKKGQSLSFSSSESLPSDVDEKKAKIEQRGEDILVRLPKVVGKTPNKSKINSGEDDQNKLKPLKPTPGDVTI